MGYLEGAKVIVVLILITLEGVELESLSASTTTTVSLCVLHFTRVSTFGPRTHDAIVRTTAQRF